MVEVNSDGDGGFCDYANDNDDGDDAVRCEGGNVGYFQQYWCLKLMFLLW